MDVVLYAYDTAQPVELPSPETEVEPSVEVAEAA